MIDQLRISVWVCVLCLFPLLIFSQNLNNESVAFPWRIIEITNSNGTDRVNISAEDQLVISIDPETRIQAFTFATHADSTSFNGTWQLQGDSLVLTYGLIPLKRDIDSIAYHTENDQAAIIYYKGEDEIARQTQNGIFSEPKREAFLVELDERGNLMLKGENRILQLGGRNELLQAPFSFMDVVRAMIGMVFLLGLAWLFSTNRKAIDWRLVGSGLLLQLIFALLVLKVSWINIVFSKISAGFVTVLDFTMAGSSFLFDGIVDVQQSGYIFAFQVLPIIVFFSALTSLFYYMGVLQKIVYGFAWVMSKTMKLSGAESLAAAGNIFLGQTESPLLVKPYLSKMTRSEMMALMTGGMATIAGSVFGAYIGYLGGADPLQKTLFATHLLTASIMSAPAALVLAKMLVPETEEIAQDLRIPKDKIGSNVLDAITNGATEGLKLAVNVAIMLLVFLAMIKAANYILGDLIGHFTGLNDWVVESTNGKFSAFGLEYIFGLVLSPVAWLMGVPADDIMVIGQLLGEKTVANEFVAYGSLGAMKASGTIVHYKSLIIATYALCGFANFSSIGIQIGGIGALAPSKRKTLSELGLRAMIGGTLAAFMTAILAGMLFNI